MIRVFNYERNSSLDNKMKNGEDNQNAAEKSMASKVDGSYGHLPTYLCLVRESYNFKSHLG